MNKVNAIINGKIKITAIEWYVPHYTRSITQQNILMNQIIKKMATQLQYPEKSVFMKEVNTQNFWTFELGTQEGNNITVWKNVVFQQNDRQHDQNLNNDTFCRLPVTSAQCIIGNERYPDSAILLNHDDDNYWQEYGQIQASFKALTKDDILQSYINEDEDRSPNEGNKFGYNIHVFDIRYQKNFENAQSVKVEFKFSENIPAGIYGYALVLTNRLVSISSDSQRMFDLN